MFDGVRRNSFLDESVFYSRLVLAKEEQAILLAKFILVKTLFATQNFRSQLSLHVAEKKLKQRNARWSR
jgi:hypothetical protein